MKPTKDQGEGQDAYALILQSIDKGDVRSEEHTSELQSHSDLVCRLLLEKKKPPPPTPPLPPQAS